MYPQLGQGFLQPHGLDRTSAPHRRQVGRVLGGTVNAGEEGIGATLSSDGRFGSMAAVHDGGIAERKQLTLDALDQLVEITAREIGPADRAREQHVACEDHPLPHQAYASGRVPRRVTHRGTRPEAYAWWGRGWASQATCCSRARSAGPISRAVISTS